MKNSILVPIVTPFKNENEIDYDSLQQLVKKLLNEGADGIYACGSSAECFSLREQERKKSLEAIIEAAEGAFVVAHVGAPGTSLAVDFAKHAKNAGANAISSVPPFYFTFNFNEIKQYYIDLVDNADLPLMLYNIPQTTGRRFTAAQFEELLSDDRIPYLKFTDTDFYSLEQIKSHTGKTIYSGKDENFLSALSAGADGAIGTTFNFMLDKYINIFKLFKENKMAEALKIQHSANEVIKVVCDCGLLESAKYLVALKGINVGHARKPFSYLTFEQKIKLTDIALKEGVIANVK